MMVHGNLIKTVQWQILNTDESDERQIHQEATIIAESTGEYIEVPFVNQQFVAKSLEHPMVIPHFWDHIRICDHRWAAPRNLPSNNGYSPYSHQQTKAPQKFVAIAILVVISHNPSKSTVQRLEQSENVPFPR